MHTVAHYFLLYVDSPATSANFYSRLLDKPPVELNRAIMEKFRREMMKHYLKEKPEFTFLQRVIWRKQKRFAKNTMYFLLPMKFKLESRVRENY